MPGTDDGEPERLIGDDLNRHLRVSLASGAWLNEAGECLKTLCESLCNTREGDALLGIQLACGVYGEWHQWGMDVSAPMQRLFRRWLRSSYADEAALRQAWGDAALTFDTAPFVPQLFAPCDDGIFRDPQRSRAVIDSQRAFQQAVPMAILHFARIVKNALPEVLTGCFYGYYINVFEVPIMGHLCPELLFVAKDTVDFLSGPFSYLDRTPEGITVQRALLESCRLNGMLWLTEMDQRPVGITGYPGGDPARLPQTVATLRRAVLQPLLAGHGLWYYDHRMVPGADAMDGVQRSTLYHKEGWWDTVPLMREVKRLQKLSKKYLQTPWQPAADVLLVYDTEAFYYHTMDTQQLQQQIQEVVARCGAVYDCILLADLEKAELQRYRCILFVNTFVLTSAQRALAAKAAEGRTAVWLYAAGYCDGNTLSVENIRAAAGIRVRRMEKPAARMEVCADGKTAVLSVEGVLPQFCADEPATEVLARYDSGEAAAVRKGNAVWSALPTLHSALLKPVLRQAGVHCWCDTGDQVLAGMGAVAVSRTAGDGPFILRLKNGRNRRVRLRRYTTAVYRAADGRRLL